MGEPNQVSCTRHFKGSKRDILIHFEKEILKATKLDQCSTVLNIVFEWDGQKSKEA